MYAISTILRHKYKLKLLIINGLSNKSAKHRVTDHSNKSSARKRINLFFKKPALSLWLVRRKLPRLLRKPFFLICMGRVFIQSVLKQIQMFKTKMTSALTDTHLQMQHLHMLFGIYKTVNRNVNILCSHLTALLHEITSELYLNQVAGLSIGRI